MCFIAVQNHINKTIQTHKYATFDKAAKRELNRSNSAVFIHSLNRTLFPSILFGYYFFIYFFYFFWFDYDLDCRFVLNLFLFVCLDWRKTNHHKHPLVSEFNAPVYEWGECSLFPALMTKLMDF